MGPLLGVLVLRSLNRARPVEQPAPAPHAAGADRDRSGDQAAVDRAPLARPTWVSGVAREGIGSGWAASLPNNPLKLPFFVLCALIGSFVAVVGGVAAAEGRGVGWLLLAGGIAVAVVCYFPIKAIRRGRNPWWMRAPLNRWWRTRR